MMKTNPYLMLLFFVVALFTACKKSDIVQENDFNKSYKTWINFKSTSNDTYRYKVVSSSWVGISTETLITIKNGKVTERAYVEKRRERNTNELITYDQWTESGQSLNTHQTGASTLTLDQVYEKAKTDWLLKRANAKTSFEANNNGMISGCGYVENNCADDCFIGISISLIEKI